MLGNSGEIGCVSGCTTESKLLGWAPDEALRSCIRTGAAGAALAGGGIERWGLRELGASVYTELSKVEAEPFSYE